MTINQNNIKKILVISLSNIGDLIMTLPVIDILKRDFPAARIDVVVDPRGEPLVRGNPDLGKIYIYRKKAPGGELFKWLVELIKERYDLAVDLRNTAIPFLIFAKHKTPIMFRRPVVDHMRQQHLKRLESVHDFIHESKERYALHFSLDDVAYVDQLLARCEMRDARYALLAPGSRAEKKRWKEDGFAQLADELVRKYQVGVVFAGDDGDRAIIKRIMAMMKMPAVDLAGQLTLPQFGVLMSKCRLAVTNDSAAMHLASYLKIPVLVFFGPSNSQKCGPWSAKSLVVQKAITCPACAGNAERGHICLNAVNVEDALAVLEPHAKEIFNGK